VKAAAPVLLEGEGSFEPVFAVSTTDGYFCGHEWLSGAKAGTQLNMSRAQRCNKSRVKFVGDTGINRAGREGEKGRVRESQKGAALGLDLGFELHPFAKQAASIRKH